MCIRESSSSPVLHACTGSRAADVPVHFLRGKADHVEPSNAKGIGPEGVEAPLDRVLKVGEESCRLLGLVRYDGITAHHGAISFRWVPSVVVAEPSNARA